MKETTQNGNSRIALSRSRVTSHSHKTLTPETFQVRGKRPRAIRRAVAMASPLENDSGAEELFYVGVRKYGLDETTPWYERWFFRGVYLPFVRWSFKWLHIPAQGTLHEDGSFSWVEHIGIATDEQSAREMCKGEFYVVHCLPVNEGLPKESLQYKGHVYPKSVMPDRYRRRTFPLTAEPVKHLAVLRDQITNLGKVAGT